MEFKEALQRARNLKVDLDKRGLVTKVLQSKDIDAKRKALQGLYKFEIEIRTLDQRALNICNDMVRKNGGELTGTVIQIPVTQQYYIPFTLGGGGN